LIPHKNHFFRDQPQNTQIQFISQTLTITMARKTLQQQYRPHLAKFFSWKDGIQYGNGFAPVPAAFAGVTPHMLTRYMKFLAFGTETPGPDDHPVHRRSSGLAFVKKALSFFWPDNTTPWNTAAQTGNPTMSKEVNKLIDAVKKLEVRKQGKKSNAKRDMKRAEFKKTLELLQAARGFANQYKATTMMKLQFHLIARMDDICNLESSDLREHEQFGVFALQTQVAWSKNVNEERDCPPQIILGANDPDFCPLLALAGYLESRFDAQWGSARYLFGERNDDGEPTRSNSNYSNALKAQWKKDAFKEVASQVRGSIGTHSLRKFGATWAAEHGCTSQDVETRGRWKGGKSGRVVNLYINVKQLPTDGKVAGVLCVGQPVKYRLKPNSGITRDWLLTHVVPGIRDHYDTDSNNRIADVLALPLLFACLNPDLEHLMSQEVMERVEAAWATLRAGTDHPIDWNPVEKVVLQVHRYENELVIDELLAMGNDGGGGGGTGGAGGDLMVANQVAGNQQQLGIIVNQLHQVKQKQSEDRQAFETGMSSMRTYNQHQFQLVHRTLGRMLQQAPTRRVARPAALAEARHLAGVGNGNNGGAGRGPAGRGAGRGNGGGGRGNGAPAGGRGGLGGYLAGRIPAHRRLVANDASLSKTPRHLHDLWREWTDGLFNNKPASQLSPTERGGRLKHIYYKRKHVWDVIKRFTDKGITHLVAIDKIEQAYGPGKSVTFYIKRIMQDKKTGGHPSLTVV